MKNIIFFLLVLFSLQGFGQAKTQFVQGAAAATATALKTATTTTLQSVTRSGKTTAIVTDAAAGGTFNYSGESLTDDNGIVFPASGGGHWVRDISNARGVNASWFSSLSTCIAALSSTATTLVVSTPITLTANLTIPVNVNLEILKSGSINTNGYTLTINGHFTAGRYYVFPGTSGTVVFGYGSIDAQFPEWDGAYNDNSHSDETTHGFAVQYRRILPISLGAGIYLLDSISTRGYTHRLELFGIASKGSALKQTGVARVFIQIAPDTGVSYSTLKDLYILGNSTSLGGIDLGSQYANGNAAFVKIEDVTVRDFTGTGAYGISNIRQQEVHIINPYITNCYDGVYRPNYGSVTSTYYEGAKGYVGINTHRGFNIAGGTSGLHLLNIVVESNQLEGLYSNVAQLNTISIEGCHFEGNCASGSGDAHISITGGAGPLLWSNVWIERNRLSTLSPSTRPKIYLHKVISSVIAENVGLVGDSILRTTDSCSGITVRDNVNLSITTSKGVVIDKSIGLQLNPGAAIPDFPVTKLINIPWTNPAIDNQRVRLQGAGSGYLSSTGSYIDFIGNPAHTGATELALGITKSGTLVQTDIMNIANSGRVSFNTDKISYLTRPRFTVADSLGIYAKIQTDSMNAALSSFAASTYLPYTGGTVTGGLRVGSFPNSLTNGYATMTPQLNNTQVSGYSAFSVGVKDGTHDRSWAGFVDETNGIQGITTSYSSGAIPFIFQNVGVERWRVGTNGNFAIGTTNTDSSLNIGGSLKVTGLYPGSTSDSILSIKANGSFGYRSGAIWNLTGNAPSYGNYLGTSNNLSLSLRTNGIERVNIDSATGNIRIGSYTPAAKLGIGGAITTMNFHGVEDWHVITPDSATSSNLGYASFDARPELTGNSINQHFVGVQARPIYSGSRGITNFWDGIDVKSSHTGTGTVALYRNLFIQDITGSGPITNNYGIYIDPIVRGTNNYAIYSAGGLNYFGGAVKTNSSTQYPLLLESSSSGTSLINASGLTIYNTNATTNNYGGILFTDAAAGAASAMIAAQFVDRTNHYADIGFLTKSAAGYVEKMRITSTGSIVFPTTVTAGGTTGAQTINKPSGQVNFAAAATTLVVTNSLVTTSSQVMVTVYGSDATATSARVTKASGSFTITLNAAATAETAVGFWVIN